MLVPDTVWWTRQSVVCQQTGTICHKMDSSMQQTTGTINFLHSFHEWLPPMLSCGQCGPTLSIGTISRFRLCRGSWRLKINIWQSFVHYWKSNVYRSVGCVRSKRQCLDGLPAFDSWVWLLKYLVCLTKYQKPTQACTRETGVEMKGTPKIKQVLDQNVDLSNIDQVPSNAHLSEKESQLYIF